MEMLLMIFLPAILAGIVQGITGFGSGIVLMVFLPYIFQIMQSSAVSGAICGVLSLSMAYRYRKYIHFNEILLPAVLYLVVSSLCVYFGKDIDQQKIKLLFGIFLIILSLYFLLMPKSNITKLSIPTSIICIIISGACEGIFGIGGPLMVIYFLTKTTTKQEYLGTIQGFFLLNATYLIIFRSINGILTLDLIPYIMIGTVGILFGLKLANKIVDKLDENIIRKMTHVLIGISGVINLITSL